MDQSSNPLPHDTGDCSLIDSQECLTGVDRLRFVSGEPKPKPIPEAVWINPPSPTLTTQEIALQLIPPSVSTTVDRFRFRQLSFKIL